LPYCATISLFSGVRSTLFCSALSTSLPVLPLCQHLLFQRSTPFLPAVTHPYLSWSASISFSKDLLLFCQPLLILTCPPALPASPFPKIYSFSASLYSFLPVLLLCQPPLVLQFSHTRLSLLNLWQNLNEMSWCYLYL
jgi:hypothetical protein